MSIIKTQDLKLLKRLYKYVKPYRIKLLILFVCIFGEILFSLMQPLLWGKIIEEIFKKSLNLVYINIFYVLIMVMFQLIFKFIGSYLFKFLTNNIVYDLKTDMYKQILNFPIRIFDQISVGELISRLQEDTNSIATIITNQLLTTIMDILKIIIIGVIIFKINVILSLIVLVSFPVYWLVFFKFGKIIKEKLKILRKINDNYLNNVEQTLVGIREIRSMGAKNYAYNIFCTLSKKFKDTDLNVNTINQISNIVSMILNLVFKIVTIIIGAYFIFRGILTIQYFIAFSTYSEQLTYSLMNVTKLNSTLQQVFVSMERIFDLMDNLSYEKQIFGDIDISKVEGNIAFENVCFKYNENDIIKNATFNIRANSKIAIVGDSGSGKTTIFNLLLRFYDISSGKITIDNIDISDFNENSLRNNISIVRQEPFMLNLTIKENLLMVNNKASDNELINACRQANIHDYIMSLPEQYNTVISGNSANISGGQKQRLSIARAILKNSKIILFDEVTSGLDNISQRFIQDSIDNMSENHTVIVIAHRLSTIINSDLIIVIENGEIIGCGKHNKLIKENSKYRELYNAEFKTSNNEGVI
ncbi:ABC transporter ATP-binding protein [Clostridium perfringens]|uniref:Multidrug resistance ABC transporter ATP-binding and permease protein n=4 Tax=Bacillota TaxID=1239 RepID=A0A9X3XU47_ENTFC|nr:MULTISPECIES: ABC transporter ATP-binding protein [Bacillota]ELC8451567.1 ABC transporter ATP-binding protein [Clostridium perfringens]MBO3408833.1 ABC transporter ATP-binding protein [Clostridium perfringens]MCF2687184.1 ABC transporter ATP-binding protein [Clostridium perfringens]MCI5750767.1 ABC transporter ATP-binding protein/permease [Clostridium perfringens]MDC4242376.1 ABC transporter ATP-binding protein/permease [Clostridium tertium]